MAFPFKVIYLFATPFAWQIHEKDSKLQLFLITKYFINYIYVLLVWIYLGKKVNLNPRSAQF